MSKILFNIIDKDTSILNRAYCDHLWNALNNKFKDLFVPENLLLFEIDQSYNFRPDKVSYKVYNDDFYYPIILFSNGISSILQFRTDLIGTKIKYLKPNYISYIQLNL